MVVTCRAVVHRWSWVEGERYWVVTTAIRGQPRCYRDDGDPCGSQCVPVVRDADRDPP